MRAAKDLYSFWASNISEWLKQDLKKQGDDICLNLASPGVLRPRLKAKR